MFYFSRDFYLDKYIYNRLTLFLKFSSNLENRDKICYAFSVIAEPIVNDFFVKASRETWNFGYFFFQTIRNFVFISKEQQYW